MDTANITAEAIRELAQKHPEAAEALKAMCPDAFPEPFRFGEQYTLSQTVWDDGPLFIGHGFAPDALSLKCLILSRNWRMKTQEHDGRTILTFYRK